MRYRAIALGALLIAGSSAAGAAAHAGGSSGGKTVVRIDATGGPTSPNGGTGRFTLTAGKTTDRGTMSYSFPSSAGTLSLSSRRGTALLRLKRTRSGLSVDSQGLDLWTGTWSIVNGTGVYASAKGVGAFVGIIGPSYRVAFHLEGFLPAPLGQ